jgi:hypothetical protein
MVLFCLCSLELMLREKKIEWKMDEERLNCIFFYFRHTHTFCSKREHTIYITLHMIFYILKEATIDFP